MFVISSCKHETLAPKGLKKVLLVQIDYNTFLFEGGKEFSYFENDNSKIELPIQSDFFPGTTNRLTMLYLTDTIFEGIQSQTIGEGKRLYPTEIDPPIHYFRNKNPLDKPDTSHFQTLFYDLGTEVIPYDSIWNSISLLTIVSEYQNQNNTANIGLFLFRPTASSATKEDWKWYLVFKN